MMQTKRLKYLNALYRAKNFLRSPGNEVSYPLCNKSDKSEDCKADTKECYNWKYAYDVMKSITNQVSTQFLIPKTSREKKTHTHSYNNKI